MGQLNAVEGRGEEKKYNKYDHDDDEEIPVVGRGRGGKVRERGGGIVGRWTIKQRGGGRRS